MHRHIARTAARMHDVAALRCRLRTRSMMYPRRASQLDCKHVADFSETLDVFARLMEIGDAGARASAAAAPDQPHLNTGTLLLCPDNDERYCTVYHGSLCDIAHFVGLAAGLHIRVGLIVQ